MNPNPFMAADEFDIEREELLAEIEQLKAKKQFTDTKPLVGHAGDELKRAIALNEFATTIDSLNTEIERLKTLDDAEKACYEAQIKDLKAKNATEYRRGHDDGVRAEALTNDHDS